MTPSLDSAGPWRKAKTLARAGLAFRFIAARTGLPEEAIAARARAENWRDSAPLNPPDPAALAEYGVHCAARAIAEEAYDLAEAAARAVERFGVGLSRLTAGLQAWAAFKAATLAAEFAPSVAALLERFDALRDARDAEVMEELAAAGWTDVMLVDGVLVDGEGAGDAAGLAAIAPPLHVETKSAFMYAKPMFGKLFGKKSKDDPAPEPPKPAAAPQAAPHQAAPPPVSARVEPAEATRPPGAMAPIEPAPRPAVNTSQDSVAAMAARAQAGAADLADLASQVERAIRAGIAGRGAPVTTDALAALRQAAESLVAAQEPAAQAAVHAILNGQLGNAFATLQADAQPTSPAGIDRLRRLGALSFLVDAVVSGNAYEAAYNADRRDFWQCIFVARVRGLAGEVDNALTAAEAALAEARSAHESSAAQAELALIALGRNDRDGARRHGRAAVEAVRAAPDGQELAQRLCLLGDISVMLGDVEDADTAYGEALSVLRRLGAQAPSDVNLARIMADAQEKYAAMIGRQKRFDDAIAACAQAVDLRRKLIAARPDEYTDQMALGAALNTLGEIKRNAGDTDGARAAFIEAGQIIAPVLATRPYLGSAHRERWIALWRLAQLPDGGVAWGQVADALEAAAAQNALPQGDLGFLKEARQRAGRPG